MSNKELEDARSNLNELIDCFENEASRVKALANAFIAADKRPVTSRGLGSAIGLVGNANANMGTLYELVKAIFECLVEFDKRLEALENRDGEGNE